MSLGPSDDWFAKLLGTPLPVEGDRVQLGTESYVMRDTILRAEKLLSAAQSQTADTFGFKWHQREIFDVPESHERVRGWLIERYGDIEDASWFAEYGEAPLVVDAGCGAGISGAELFRSRIHQVRYLGVDVSEAVEVAATLFAERGYDARFLQADLMAVPLPDESADVIFSEGVLHHTDSTREALGKLTRLLRPGGRIMFYVYRAKGPIREFTDDYIRDALQEIAPPEAWQMLMPLTRLGYALADMKVTVNVPEDVPILNIPAGPIDLQRLFYWHVFKAFHHPATSLEEANHINFDWYAPRNAHRQTEDEVRSWCSAFGLEIDRERIEPAGITVIARKVVD